MTRRLNDRCRRRVRLTAALLATLATVATTHAQVPDPGKHFFGNFWAPAYFMPLFPLEGEQFGGDLTATYDQAYVPNRPNLELLIVGEFPRARFFSITVYDDHGATVDTHSDFELEPLFPGQVNPYRPGGPANTEDILYAVRVKLGNGLVETPADGCGFTGMDVTSNVLQAHLRHTAGTIYSQDMSGFTATSPDGTVVVEHDDELSNRGVELMVRRYLEADDGNTGAFDLTRPVVFLRSSLSGCALDIWRLAQKPQPDPSAPLPPSEWFDFHTTINAEQVAAHIQHAKDYPASTPDGLDPDNRYAWYRAAEYILAANAQTGYLSSVVPMPGKPATLNSKKKVLRMRFRMPTVPCRERVCALTGTEELRYWGLSIVEGERTVIASLSDLDMNPDADGYVTLVITFGTELPAHVTEENGYTVVTLPESDPRLVTIRNILPSPILPCRIESIPFKTNEHHANGGYMGEYAPFVDFPFASTLPPTATPYEHPDSCELPPS